jgi:hypothetical protein
MNISDEKEHVYSLMREITQERRKLTDIYFSLKERLDDLNKLEQRGLGELSLKGYIDLKNQHDKEIAVGNIERESKRAIEKIVIEDKPKENNIIPKAEIERQKEKDSPSKRSSKINLDKIVGYIVSILKEHGTPMRAKDLYDEVNVRLETELEIKNFYSNILRRACLRSNKIQKAYRGFYQYRI